MSVHPDAVAHHHDHGKKGSHEVAPGEIAVGVVIGRASENFDFFVYGIASALVFPTVFFPFVDGRFSTVLQVPIHPVCEGLLLDQSITDGRLMSSYFTGGGPVVVPPSTIFRPPL